VILKLLRQLRLKAISPVCAYLVSFLTGTLVIQVAAKIPTTVWHTHFAGQDSLFNEGLARDLSQALAEDTALKVFDSRRRGAGLLDSLFAKEAFPSTAKLANVLPAKIALAISLECRSLEINVVCRMEGRFISTPEKTIIDTGFYLSNAIVQRHLFGACIARRWREHWLGELTNAQQTTKIVFRTPALPARLLRDLEILKSGSLLEFPLGTQFETGDMGAPAVGLLKQAEYVFFPNSVFAYPAPNVIQVIRGRLGMWHVGDTSTLSSQLMQAARLDSANIIWKNLGHLTSIDSSNLVWKKLTQIASLDRGVIWHKLGLLAYQDSMVILTPACVIRGRPEVMQVQHEGGETRIELIQGEIAALPLLSSQNAVRIPILNQAVTRGFALENTPIQDKRAEAISASLAAIAAPKTGKSLAELLPGRIFSQRPTLQTWTLDAQDFLSEEMAEIDLHPERLGPPQWNAEGSLKPLTPGKYEAGCYLCRPDRLGP
jgi:hypothetical protein